MSTTLDEVQSYPALLDAVRALVGEHLKMTFEPLCLAIYYASPRDPADVFLFEVIDGFGMNSVSEDGEVFEVSYGVRDAFPLAPGQRLHLLLTNPVEVEVMFRNRWAATTEIRRAVQDGDYAVLYAGADAGRLLEVVRGG